MGNNIDRNAVVALRQLVFEHLSDVTAYLEQEVLPAVGKQPADPKEQHTFPGLLGRVVFWLRSLERLQRPADFQAHAAACRALFEIALDLVLLCRSPTDVEKYLLWERSAKLHLAEEVVQESGSTDTTHERAFIAGQGASIRAERLRLWARDDHPLRWTKTKLWIDVGKADAIESIGFAEFYREQYPQLCWAVHGTGLSLLRDLDIDSLAVYSTQALANALSFALVAARTICGRYGLQSHVERITRAWQTAQDHIRNYSEFIGG